MGKHLFLMVSGTPTHKLFSLLCHDCNFISQFLRPLETWLLMVVTYRLRTLVLDQPADRVTVTGNSRLLLWARLRWVSGFAIRHILSVSWIWCPSAVDLGSGSLNPLKGNYRRGLFQRWKSKMTWLGNAMSATKTAAIIIERGILWEYPLNLPPLWIYGLLD